jgi:hypothetical protein
MAAGLALPAQLPPQAILTARLLLGSSIDSSIGHIWVASGLSYTATFRHSSRAVLQPPLFELSRQGLLRGSVTPAVRLVNY